jgi:hypothetical protein
MATQKLVMTATVKIQMTPKVTTITHCNITSAAKWCDMPNTDKQGFNALSNAKESLFTRIIDAFLNLLNLGTKTVLDSCKNSKHSCSDDDKLKKVYNYNYPDTYERQITPKC